MKEKDVIEEFESWIDNTHSVLGRCDEVILSDFKDRYEKVLAAARNQTGEVARRVVELHTELGAGRLSSKDALEKYIDAMSVEVDGQHIFLPSYSDECLKELFKASLLFLSPYRGIYYCWALGDIAYLFSRGENERAWIELRSLSNQLTHDVEAESWQSNPRYERYYAALEKAAKCRTCEDCDPMLRQHIDIVKKLYVDVVLKCKRSWLERALYPARTSTHFYLSGVRFYHYPLFSEELSTLNLKKERYYVHSTDSGIFKAEEHYGMILESTDPDEAQEMVDKLPPGCLALDIEEERATDDDCRRLLKFEEWSRLITEKAYRIVSATLDWYDFGYEHKAVRSYLASVSKNPARKFYFDTGVFKAAVLAGTAKRLPPISYVTTYASVVDRKSCKVSTAILERFLDTGGLEYYLLKKEGWVQKYAVLGRLTLIPSRELARFTNALCSIRGDDRKISHGVSSWGVHLYDVRKAASPAVTKAVQRYWEGGKARVELLRGVIGVKGNLARFSQMAKQLRKDTNVERIDTENMAARLCRP